MGSCPGSGVGISCPPAGSRRSAGSARTPLVDASKHAFIDGANWAYLIMAAVVACAAVAISLLAPERDGQQLRLIQWLTQHARRRRTSIRESDGYRLAYRLRFAAMNPSTA